jgi:hypothetical protein
MSHVTVIECAPPHTIYAQRSLDNNIGKQIPCYVNGISVGLATIIRAAVADDGRRIEITYDIPVAIGYDDKFRTDEYVLT